MLRKKKGNQPCTFIGRTDAEDEDPILWPPDGKSQSLEKTLMMRKNEGKRKMEQHRTRWLDCITDSMDTDLNELQETDSGGQRSLACCSSWGRKELETT